MRINTLRKTAVALFALSFYACKEGEKIDLRFKFQPGTRFQYTMDTKQTITQSMNGQSVTVKQNILMVYSNEIRAGIDNHKNAIVSYDRISMKMESGDAKIEYDSGDTALQHPMFSYMSAMIGHPFTVELDENGTIVKVTGVDSIIDGMSAGNPLITAETKAALQKQFNDSSVRNTMQQSFDIYPGQPVKTGATWNRTYISPAFDMKVATQYTLSSVSNGIAHIDIKATVKSDPNATMNGTNMTMDITGEQTGKLDLEISTGMITDCAIRQKTKGSMSLMGKSIPIEAASDIHIWGKKMQ